MPSKTPALRTQVINGISWQAVSILFKLVFNIASIFFLSRLISPAHFGLFKYSVVLFTYLQVISSLGIPQAIIQSNKTSRIYLSTSFFAILIFSILALALFGLLFLLLNQVYPSSLRLLDQLPKHVFFLLAFGIFIWNISEYLEAIFLSQMKFKSVSITNTVAYGLGGCGLTIILASCGFNVYSLLIGYLSTPALKILIYQKFYSASFFLKFSTLYLRKILRFGFGFTLSRIANLSALQIDNLVIASFLGTAALGFYSRSYELNMISIGLFASLIDKVFFTTLSKKFKEKSFIRKTFLDMHTLFVSIFLIISFVIIILKDQIVSLLLGANWMASIVPLSILAIALPFRAGYRVSDLFARAGGYVYKRALIQWLFVLCVILAMLTGVKWGLTGASYAVVFSMALNWLMMSKLSLNQLKIPLNLFIKSLSLPIFVLSLLLSFYSLYSLNPFFNSFSHQPFLYVLVPLMFITFCTYKGAAHSISNILSYIK